ncbi:multicilin [Microcaecilia unicolor]|uniref:Multicilin n=1 Tax=Microcaecilia unicolor TaxID=1415580 RepID=A0A6P7X6Q2_9AMPH|nr:multicilin [Microcaecilia unicolor]
MQNRRKAFDQLCPNRVLDLASRQIKKQVKPEKKSVTRRIFGDNSPVTVYIDQSPDTVDSALSTIDWQDLADCTSVLQQDCTSVLQQDSSSNASTQQNRSLQTSPEFSLQDFRDVVDNLMSDPSSLMQPSLGAVDFNVPPCDVSAFEPCMVNSVLPAETNLLHVGLQTTTFPEQYWRDLADHNQKALGDALVENNQLHLTLTEKQEEIASLKERNVQLKELANQAKHLSSVLDELMSHRPQEDGKVPAEFFINKSPTKRSIEELYANNHDGKQVDEILREITEKCYAALRTIDPMDNKRTKLHVENPGAPDCSGGKCPAINMHGAFHGLQTCTGQSSVNLSNSDLEEGLGFRTSIRDHCTIRTLAFPQGNAFMIRTSNGGYKFRWVPS